MKMLLVVLAVLFGYAAPALAQQPQLVVQTGHSDFVHALAFSPDGKLLASASADHTIKLWDVASGRELHSFAGHTSGVHAVAFSADGRTLASGGGDAVIRLWDVATGSAIRALTGHTHVVSSLRYSPDGKTLASGSWDKTARLWDVASGRTLHVLEGHGTQVNTVAFAPDGKTLASGSDDGTVRFWDAASGIQLRMLRDLPGVQSVEFSPDGKRLAIGSHGTGDGSGVRIWDSSRGDAVQVLGQLPYYDAGSVAFSPDGTMLATAAANVSFTSKLWDVGSGRELRSLPKSAEVLTFNPDGKSIAAVGVDSVIRLWNAADGKELRTFARQSSPVLSVAVSADGARLAAGGRETIGLWDLTAGRETRTLSGRFDRAASVAFSPDGQTLACGGDTIVTLWDLATGDSLRTLTGFSLPVNSVAFSPDGKTLAVGAENVTLWDAGSGRQIRVVNDASGSEIAALAFSPDGRTIVSGRDDDFFRPTPALEVSDAAGGAEHALVGQADGVLAVAFSADGRLLASGNKNGTIQLWDAASGRALRTLTGHAGPVASVAFAPDGKMLASASGDQTIKLWNVDTGEEARTLRGHAAGVTTVALTPNGELLVSGSADGTIKLWRPAVNEPLATLISLNGGDWVVVTPDGLFDMSPGAGPLMHYVLSTARGYELIAFDQLKLRYYQPGLLQTVVRGAPLPDVSRFRDVTLWPDVQEVAAPAPAGASRTIRLTNRGGGIGRVQVFVNDREFIEDARPAALRQNPDVAEALVTFSLAGAPVVSGEVPRVKIVAWNYDARATDRFKGYVSGRGVDLQYTPGPEPPPRKPSLYAIIGGVSKYRDDKLDLRFAAKDAEDIEKAVTVGGANLFGTGQTHVTVLATGDRAGVLAPTKANFRKAFETYASLAKPEDVLFVYLSGHGISLRRGSDIYLYLTSEANTTDTSVLERDSDLLERATISSEELKTWFKAVPALKQVLILDTCAAGAAAQALSSQARTVEADAIRAIDQMQDVTGLHVLMGSAADAVSYEATQYGQGLLTYSLLQGIKSGEGLEAGGRVDVSRLFQYASTKVPQLARNIGGIQRPEIRAPSGDGRSFAIGLVASLADKQAIPLASPKPLVLRPVLQNQQLGYDNLHLTPLLRDSLRDESYATVRGRDASPLVFVDAEEMPDGIVPSGNYRIQGDTITVTLNLVRDERVIATFTTEGQRADLPGLIRKLAANVTAGR